MHAIRVCCKEQARFYARRWPLSQKNGGYERTIWRFLYGLRVVPFQAFRKCSRSRSDRLIGPQRLNMELSGIAPEDRMVK